MRSPSRLVIVGLALLATALIAAVIVKYWPPEVDRWVWDAAGRLGDAIAGAWRRVGGRWVTLLVVALGGTLGLAILRRRRGLGLLVIEVSVVCGAILALLQPDGW